MANLYTVTIQDCDDQAAIAWANGFVFMECEIEDRPLPKHSKLIDTVNGVHVYYDYGADYYFFVECEDQ